MKYISWFATFSKVEEHIIQFHISCIKLLRGLLCLYLHIHYISLLFDLKDFPVMVLLMRQTRNVYSMNIPGHRASMENNFILL